MALTTTRTSRLLTIALAADAAITAVTGLAMFLGADLLASTTGLPEALLRYAGLSLIPFALLVGMLASRDVVSAVAVRAIIIANAVWVVDSLLLLMTGWVQPSLFGYVFVVGQAIVVAAFAEVQYIGLKAATPV